MTTDNIKQYIINNYLKDIPVYKYEIIEEENNINIYYDNEKIVTFYKDKIIKQIEQNK